MVAAPWATACIHAHDFEQELRPIEDKIKKNLTPMDMGHLVNHLP